MSRERDKYRKFESGYDKQKKRDKHERFLRSQQGAFEKFLKQDDRESDVSKQTEIIPKQDEITESDVSKQTEIIPIPSTSKKNESLKDLMIVNTFADSVETQPTSSDNTSNNLTEGLVLDVYDPGLWPRTIPTYQFDEIIQKGPLQVSNFRFPLNADKRHFSAELYKRTLANGEQVPRQWLVYSKSRDKAYCFCCKLFRNESGTKLASEGYSDWGHINSRLNNHETSPGHAANVKKWIECETRLGKASAIDEKHRSMIRKEKEHWREVLKRIINGIKYLAEHNIAFRGSNCKLYEPNNGNFLGLIEMMATFDPVMQEHVRRIRSSEIHDHYLGANIQNELIKLLSEKVKEKNVMDIKAAKYFSVLLDCTPDLSHQEQLSLVIRFVKFENNGTATENEGVSVEEHFIEFLDVKSTTGKNLTDVLLEELDKIGLEIKDCRGQGYDNGSNMKGVHSGVQARILEINPMAFYMPCASHSLNLLICDAAKCSPKAMTFFGVVQRVYEVFSASTKRWNVLKKHVPDLTVKKSCDTRWESKLESVKALRYQIKEVHDALVEVVETTDDPKAKSEARSLVNEISSYEFLVALAIWHDVLFAVNSVSKNLQAEKMHLGVASQLLHGLVKFFDQFRIEGFAAATMVAREMSEALGTEPKFQEVRQRKRRRLFEYEGDDEPVSESAEQTFRVEYFYRIVDCTAQSLTKRFEQMARYDTMFGFLHNVEELKTIEKDKLQKKCKDLEVILSFEEQRDISGDELFTELKVLRELLPVEVETAAGVLRFMNRIQNPFPNAFIAYRILLTIPVTVASAERSFSRLKLIKTYLRSNMSQERLTSLATLSIEADTTSKVNFDDLIDDFAGLKARKVKFV